MNTELSPTTTVGCIGLGIMGLPAAKNMRHAGWPLAVYARRPQTAAALADASVFSITATVGGRLSRGGAQCVRYARCGRNYPRRQGADSRACKKAR